LKKALISVWNKEGIVELAQFLINNEIEIVSTGGTKKILEQNNIDVTSIAEITDMGSIMDGRVKTLNPKIFGGILADRNNKNHLDDLAAIGGVEFDVVVVNFYPFQEEAANKEIDLEKAIEYIDIGGPSMVRAAAKNYKNVIPLCSPSLYTHFIDLYSKHGGVFSENERTFFASKVFEMTSDYESKIFNYFNRDIESNLPLNMNINLYQKSILRYGENPHQKSGFYINSISKNTPWEQHQGKELSYNNYNDLESAFNISNEFLSPACVIIKHANPCGFGIGNDLEEAYNRAVSTDPVSYFGGIVGFNRRIDSKMAKELVKPFLECIIAPEISPEALEIFKVKKNLRVLTLDNKKSFHNLSVKSVAGGFIIQEQDISMKDFDDFKLVTKKKINQSQKHAMKIGWKIVKYVKSNAIVIANKNQILGIGAGQMSRVDSVKIAIRKAQEAGFLLDNSIIASDAFFPFPDSIELAAENGIFGIIQPGGSIKDDAIIEKADELDITMIMTGERHFYH